MPSVKILISYKEKHRLIKSDILMPIQTGCAIAQNLFSGMLRDDEGENISDKNPIYAELTAQYWAWKNYCKLGNPDYIGFMHYRRHFIFDDWIGDPKRTWPEKGPLYMVSQPTRRYLSHMSDDKILNVVNGYDCIALKPYDISAMELDGFKSDYLLFSDHPDTGKVFDVFIATAKKLHPDYIDAIERIEFGKIQYLCNMFIMKKELFFEYSEFCFSILNAVEREMSYTDFGKTGFRFLGYLGEFCLSIFIFKHKEDGIFKIRELNGAMLEFSRMPYLSTKVKGIMKPIFLSMYDMISKNPYVFSKSKQFAKFVFPESIYSRLKRCVRFNREETTCQQYQ